MFLRRTLLAALVALTAFPAWAIPQSVSPPGGGSISVSTSPVTGTPTTLSNVPTGATCAWLLDGVANGSTSCISYTPSVPDVGKVLSAAVTLSSGTITLANAGPVGNPYALTLNSSLFTSTTDLTPVSQFINGWTADLYLTGLTPADATANYNFGTIPGSTKLSFPVVRPGYDATGNATTVTDTIYGTIYLRQPYANNSHPTEGTTAGLMLASIALSDYVFNSDTPGVATILAGLYTDLNGVSSLAGSASVSGTSTRAYPRPIGAWVSLPARRIDGTQDEVIEFFGGQAYGREASPLAAVKITLNDGSHTPVSHFATLGLSSALLSTTCTATNGSNVLTACGSTAGFIVGERLTVPGIPGQPKIASIDSSTQMTLAATGTVTTTNSSSTISVTNNTVALGDGMGDGLFVGAKVNCSTINSGTDATITVEPTTAGLTIASGKTTAAPFTINTSTTTAGTNTSCTFKHVYQGSTGSVRVTLGNPVPTWQATFTAAEIATFSDGVVYFRAQAYPATGDVVLDTQTGADGTNLDWQGQTFGVNGSDISPNLHNLFAYKDAAGNYAPFYAWVNTGGTASTSAAIQTTTADPGTGAAANFPNLGTACAGLKSYYNSNKTHNTANGGVIFVRAGTYVGLGTSMTSCTTKTGPQLLVTHPPADAALLATLAPAAGVNTMGPRTRFLGLIYAPTSTGYTGADAAVTSGLLGTDIYFERSWLKTAMTNTPAVNQIGAAYYLNNLIEQSTGSENYWFRPFGVQSSATAMVAGNTINVGNSTTGAGSWHVFAGIGNVTSSLTVNNPTIPATSTNYVQPLSEVFAYNKIMNGRASTAFNSGTINNLLMANNLVEIINDPVSLGQAPAMQITADNNNTPASNIVAHYNTVIGQRTNWQYAEGIPTGFTPTAATTGGALAAGTYVTQVVYALTGAPTVQTSTDGPSSVRTIASGTTGSLTMTLDKDAFHTITVLISDKNGSTPNHLALATVGGATNTTAQGLASGQTIVITDIGAAQALTSNLPGHNELKVQFTRRFNIDVGWNIKSDTYDGGGSGGNGASPNGARVGGWGGTWRVSDMGDVAVTTILPGEVLPIYSINGGSDMTDISLMSYKSDRSQGGQGATSPTTPAINLGMSNACPNVATVTTPEDRVPAHYAAWPTDIQGRARLNDGHGWAGAFESGCI